jgi:O-antigen/teichoic acid export membrane protein
MSRTARATIAAAFGYVQFGAAIVTGLWLVPFTLHHVGTRMYGYWLASGELLAYAGLSDLGVLTTLPWLIADADGRRDREELRKLVSTGAAAGAITGAGYALIVTGLWLLLPSVMHLGPSERALVQGPLVIVAISGCVAQPLRVFNTVISGLQDVKFGGTIGVTNWLLGFALTVVLLMRGEGLYALAWAAALPPLLSGLWHFLRVWRVAPDLMHSWPRPRLADLRHLFTEGFGTWIGGWGWRLVSATDSLVLAALGRPAQVAALACTNKLAQASVQLSWVPCDNGLVGLAQLAGERQGRRLREAIVVIVRVYLALASAAACVVLAANPAFVRKWVGPDLFAGSLANVLIAVLVIAMTFGHALAVVPSVLGQRLQIGLASIGCGVLHLALAFGLGMEFGIVGVLAAGVVSHGVVFAALAWKPFARATGMPETALVADVLVPWSLRFAPLALIAFAISRFAGTPSLFVTVPAGGIVALLTVLHMRPLYLAFGPVRALYDRVVRWPLRSAPAPDRAEVS